MAEAWSLKGEMALSCSGTVFCPCVLSLGDHPPTEDRCQTWAGFRFDSGHFDDVDLGGVNAGIMMDLPGIMSRGNWTAALFVDDKASAQAVKALTRIFSGRVGGTTHLLSILVGQFLGVRQVPISSNKSMIGHTLTAAGAIEAIFSLKTIEEGILPPTINYRTPDPAIPFDVVPNVARAAKVDAVLSNSFGFGGQNACLVITGEPG